MSDGAHWETVEWRDLDYLARVKTVHLSMEFEVYTVVSWGSTSYASGKPVESNGPIFELAEWHASGDETEDIAEAAPLFHGRVKWDGCSDWDWTAAKLAWHGCSPRDVADLTEAMRRTYALAAERIDHWDPDVTPQRVAEPAGWPAAATVAECANCGRRITRRLAEPAARWRHDNGGVTCSPPETKGDQP